MLPAAGEPGPRHEEGGAGAQPGGRGRGQAPGLGGRGQGGAALFIIQSY